MMKTYVDHIYERFTQNILSWDASLRSDIYVLRFMIENGMSTNDAAGEVIDYDGVICLGYSTQTGLNQRLPKMPDSKIEKWHCCHGMTGDTAQVPFVPFREDPDAEEWALRDAWFASFGIVPSGTDVAGRSIYNFGEDEDKAIVVACQRVIWRMHQSGFLQEAFGKPLPILITAEEGIVKYRETAYANPKEAIHEFVEFVQELPMSNSWFIGFDTHILFDIIKSEDDFK